MRKRTLQAPVVHLANENQTLKSQYNDLYNNFTSLQNDMRTLQCEMEELQKSHGDKDATHAKVVHFLQSKNADMNRELIRNTMQRPIGPSGIHPPPPSQDATEKTTDETHPDEAKCFNYPYRYGHYPYGPYGPYGPGPYGPGPYGPYGLYGSGLYDSSLYSSLN